MSLIIVLSLILLPLLYYLLNPPSIPTIPNATPTLPLLGNALSYGIDPITFLSAQRAKHGNIIHVNLGLISVVFFLGPEGVNAILKGTERAGISFWEALRFLLGEGIETSNRRFIVVM